MSDIDNAIKIGELVLATAEGLIDAMDKSKEDLQAGIVDLKQAIADAKKKTHDDLTADRKEADDDLDKKFDQSQSKTGNAP